MEINSALKNNKVFFRADGNSSTGYGHDVMRLLSLASMINNKFDCIFLTRHTDEFLLKQNTVSL